MTIRVRVRGKPDRPFLQLYYVDPLTGNDVTRSAGTDNVREAERKAANWEQELEERGFAHEKPPNWDGFRIRLEDEYLSTLAKRTSQVTKSALNHFEHLIGHPKRIDLITAATISRFSAALRGTGIEPTSVAAHLRHLRACLKWAENVGLLKQVPKFVMPRIATKRSLARSRAITTEEFERMLKVTKKVRPDDYKLWRFYLRGLWLSGLRLTESTLLSWDSPPLQVDLDARRPRIIFLAEGHKGRYDDIVPITPDFAELLNKQSADDRHGRVFKLPFEDPGNVGRVISDIGEKATIKVADTGKNATAHDLRRAFATRWAARVMPAVLQRLMRHRDISTTLKYYVDQSVDELGDQIWAALRTAVPCTPPSTPTGSARKKSPASKPKKSPENQG